MMLRCLIGKSQCFKGSQYFDFQSSCSNTHDEDNVFPKNRDEIMGEWRRLYDEELYDLFC